MMKFILVSLVSVFAAAEVSAATFRGAVGFDGVPGTLSLSQSGNLVRVHADGSSCTMEFGPIVGPYGGGYELAIKNGCGSKANRAFLIFGEDGRPRLASRYGRSGGYFFL